ncbi:MULTISPECIES: hypothetical protein [Enterococcus]|uniref:hypothetical protein n=1 Tax=Enterococcus TaxID=1350 RepID=UPI0001B6E198|nr:MULTISPECIES: hypothetical protein [Enterococcus]EEV47085.1 predicted protein [Enterococcus faecium 1,231,501]EGP5104622.1 hypothetical protein [Enterococcus faecium]EHQ9057363.1 hypothetical protein [Enterococcus faecium]ELB67331.1 hypothetical protein OKY_02910 [Enterococcus faecium EnGen0048]EME3506642.1 hypothetical protein [Enterococcus faecium]
MNKLIFIPYHDINYFKNSKIMTREYALLKLIMDTKPFDLYTVSKPRTFLDKKTVIGNSNNFPEETIEKSIMKYIDSANEINTYTFFDWRIITQRRGWWVKGYKDAIPKIPIEIDNDTYVYSNNPFAYELILECKRKGAKVIFDMMDNFAIHPSLNDFEKKSAYQGYLQINKISDFYCCNSIETQKFCKENFSIIPKLIKNGVFPITINKKNIEKKQQLKKKLSNYEKSVGYIGKLGTRIDEDLVNILSQRLPKVLFVYIGPHLKGQKNKKLADIIKNKHNIIEFGPISSYEIYSYLELFDILIIPHSVGKNENGGDPLKLYQYLNARKKIISTGILGVDEFKEIITITNNYEEWINEIEEYDTNESPKYKTPSSIFWENRARDLINFILMDSK